MNVGTEWLIDAECCSGELLRDIDAVRGVCEEVIADLGLRVVGDPMWHQFPQPGGVTGLYLLTESHLTCHTFPETGLATFNLYCCRPRPPFDWDERLRALIGASRVTVRTAARGAEAAARSVSLEMSDHDSLEARSAELSPNSRKHASFEAEVSDSTSAREVAQP
ncbi:MAG TPA: S-adenosylmethionine decarboxylase [Blastocatellia bacterium]|nr:S-adenosylmethionine decarboxylase [Blastocatellia bacterium]